MAYSLEFGLTMTKLYNYYVSNTYEYNWVVNDYNKGRGPAQCLFCRSDGMFDGVFYGLCTSCSRKAGPCQCVYCRVAGVDGHKLIERRQNICKFIKELQTVINDLKRDYPTDEYGIVKDGINAGNYILGLHTKHQYAKFMEECTIPFEVNQLSIGELLWSHQPELYVPDSVICSAIVAAKRTGIWEWTKKMWRESYIDVKRYEDRCVKFYKDGNPSNVILFCSGCEDAFISIPGKTIQKRFCPKCINAESEMVNCVACKEVVALQTAKKGHCWDCQYVKCTECNYLEHVMNIDEKGYCLLCQNPDHDQGWPKGD